MSLKIYLAGPIFTLGDKFRNDYFYKKLKEAFPTADIYDPLQNTDINGVEGKKKFAGSQEIANGDNSRLDNTDVLVATIDGDVLPSGTCAEIGRFSEKIARGDNKFIAGICTDNRQMYLTHSETKDAGGAAALGEQQYSYQNLYVTGLIKQSGTLSSNIDDAIESIKTWLERKRIICALDGHTDIYAYMYGKQRFPHGTKDCEEDIIKINVSELKRCNNGIDFYYVWGYPGPDYNIYRLDDYGKTWAYTKEELL